MAKKIKKSTFEDNISIIDDAIQKRRHSWHLNAVKHLDYDDIAQKIRIHVWEKWDQWEPSKGPLEPWLNTIIKNQIRNAIRDNYYNFVKPCVRCPSAEDNKTTGADNGCKLYGEQCVECPLYAKWFKTKQQAFNIKAPLPIEFHSHELNAGNNNSSDQDYEQARTNLHVKIIAKLTKTQKRVYILLYVKEKSEDEVAKIMNYKASKTGKNKHRYKQLSNYTKLFRDLAHTILEKHDIFHE